MQIKITGVNLPRYQERPGTVDPNDAWIRKILEFEASKGSAAGTGLSNFGYNTRNPKDIEEAISFFKQDYLPKVQNFPMGLRERLGDYAYNTGRSINDLLLYAAGKISLDDINSSKVFTDEWDRYKDEVLNEFNTNPSLFTWKLDKAKDDVYKTTKQVNGQPNPAYYNTWNYRADMWDPISPTQSAANKPEENEPVTLKSFDQPIKTTKPKIYGTQIADKPIGYDEEGKPVFPAGANVPPWGVEFGKHKGQISATKQDKPFNLADWQKGMQTKYPQIFTTTTTLNPNDLKVTAKLSGPTKATLLTTGLRQLGNFLSTQGDRARREKYRIESGRTDSYFPTVPNEYSRGTEEINTGEFMPNLRTPVQFPGIPSSEYYGIQQYQIGGGIGPTNYVSGTGALLPAMPSTFIDVTDPYLSAPPSKADVVTPKESPELQTVMASKGFALPAAPYTFRLASGFGPRKAPKPGASKNHNGNDMGMPEGTPLFSIKDGIVKNVYEDNKGGKQVVIFYPDGTRAGYAHLSQFNVKIGDQVRMGQQIGLSGNTGISTGPHLHFTYGYHDGKKTTKLIDPNTVFNFNEYTRDKKPKNTEVNNLAAKIINIVEEAYAPTYSTVQTTKGRRNIFGGEIFSNSNPTYSSSNDNNLNIVNSETNTQISYTHRNPLNIHIGDFARQYGGIKGHVDGNGHVAIFPSFDVGIQAAKDLLFGPSYINLTIEEARNRWVKGDPKKESSSTKHIVKALGSNKKLSELTDPEKDKLIKEFIRWEGKDAYNVFKDFKFYEEGGTFELDDDEIDYILSNGGEIEYL